MSERRYTVYFRRMDGNGTQTWRDGLSKPEAVAQQNWCFRSAETNASMVWVLDDAGRMLGEPLMKEIANAD